MATLQEKIQAEQSGRAMLEKDGLPPPDAVEYGHTCIRFFWNEPKVVLVIDIDEPPEDSELTGERPGDLGDAGEMEGEAA
jgi:hypothetical protein